MPPSPHETSAAPASPCVRSSTNQSVDNQEGGLPREKTVALSTPRARSPTTEKTGDQDKEEGGPPGSARVTPYGLRSRSPTKGSPVKTPGGQRKQLATALDTSERLVAPSPPALRKKGRTDALNDEPLRTPTHRKRRETVLNEEPPVEDGTPMTIIPLAENAPSKLGGTPAATSPWWCTTMRAQPSSPVPDGRGHTPAASSRIRPADASASTTSPQYALTDSRSNGSVCVRTLRPSGVVA